MQEKPQNAKQGINPNLLIAIIGAAATILAALIPVLINASRNEPAATVTPVPTLAAPTETVLPGATPTSPTSSGTAIPTITPTMTSVLPSATPTTPLGIYDVYLAQDRAGNSRTNVFGPQQTVYIFFSINDPSGTNSVEVVWYAVDAKGYPSNTPISREQGTVTKSTFSFEKLLSPFWKTGTYKVELYLNGSLKDTQSFEIR